MSDPTTATEVNSLDIQLGALSVTESSLKDSESKGSESVAADSTLEASAAEEANTNGEERQSDGAGGPGEDAEKKEDGSKSLERPKDKKKPYVNPDRFKTGGAPREKLTPEELAEKMQKIREQNEKIKERRLAVQADEQAFKATQAAEHAKRAANRKIQENVNQTREQNARRKMEKIQNREWDNGKKQVKERVPQTTKTESQPPAAPTPAVPAAAASS